MSVVKQIREPRADYRVLEEPALLRGFELLATAEGGVAKLRELILLFATQGKLLPQRSSDESARTLLSSIAVEKMGLVAAKVIRGRKPRPQISDEDLPFTLPPGWAWTRLGTLGDWGAGATPLRNRTDYYGGDIPWFKSGELSADVIDQSEETITQLALKECSLRENRAGDVLIAMYGATIGKAAILAGPGTTNQAVCACTPFTGVSNWYLLLLLKALRPYFVGIGAGGAQPNISREKIVATIVALPPTAEQHRIVARVEELMTLCDELEARGRLADEQHARLTATLFDALPASDSAQTLADNWQRIATHFDLLLDRPQAIDALEQTILQLAVRGLLVPQDANDEPASKLLSRIRAHRERRIAKGELKRDKPLLAVTSDEEPFPSNKGWLWTRITELCEVQGGIQKTPLRRPVKNHYLYLRVANVQRNALQLDEIERYELADDEVEKWRLRSGDLLVVEGNGSEDEIGRCAVWDGSIDPCVFQNHLIRVRPDVAATVEFLKLFLNSPDGTAEMKRLAITTSGLFNLSVGKIRNIPVPLPPLPEQQRIVARVEQLRSLCDDLRERVSQSRVTQTSLAEALVTDAVRPRRGIRLG